MSGQKRRVVVTGLGAVTPLAIHAKDSFDRMLAGESGIRPIERWDTTENRTHFAGEVRGPIYRGEEHFSRQDLKRADYFTQLGLLAAREASADAGLTEGSFDPERSGAIVGSGIGGITGIEETHNVLQEKGSRRVSPYFIQNVMMNAVSGQVAIAHNLKGPVFTTASACASSGHAIGLALREIRDGYADLVFAGGAEVATTNLTLSGFNSLRALSTRNDAPEAASRPFDRDRDGFVIAEGAGILVLEELEHARARSASIYCELVGFGQSDDAHHMTAPEETGTGPARAIGMALQDGGLNPDEVDYVNAHGTSTLYNDMIETRALKTVFGDHAASLAISSTKSMIGHGLGASSAMEAVVTALTLHRGVAHQTLNLENPDIENGCDLDYIPGQPREKQFRSAISNSLGFGGHNVSLAFRRFG